MNEIDPLVLSLMYPGVGFKINQEGIISWSDSVERIIDPEEYDKYDIQIKMIKLRTERNKKLSDSDWTMLIDSPTDKNSWQQYRQSLRDLPKNIIDLDNVIWPVPPE